VQWFYRPSTIQIPCIRFIHDVLHVNIYLHLHFTFTFTKRVLTTVALLNEQLFDVELVGTVVTKLKR